MKPPEPDRIWSYGECILYYADRYRKPRGEPCIEGTYNYSRFSRLHFRPCLCSWRDGKYLGPRLTDIADFPKDPDYFDFICLETGFLAVYVGCLREITAGNEGYHWRNGTKDCRQHLAGDS